MKTPPNKIKLSKEQVKEALDQIPLESIISGTGKKRSLTAKQKGFIKDVAMGKPKAQAYRDNYNSKTKPKYQGDAGYKIASNPVISQEIEAFKVALMAQEYQNASKLKAFIMHQLTLHALNEDNPPASRIRSLELLGKTYDVGLFVDRKEVTTVNNTNEVKAKLIEQLKEAMNRNNMTIEHDDGSSLLEEIKAGSEEKLEDGTHYTPTPQIEPIDGALDQHSIPHNQSPTFDLQPIDSKEENHSTYNVISGEGDEKFWEDEGIESTETPPISFSTQK